MSPHRSWSRSVNSVLPCHVDRLIGTSDGHPVRAAIRQAEGPVKSSISASGSYRRARATTGRIIAALEAILTKHPGETDLLNGETWL